MELIVRVTESLIESGVPNDPLRCPIRRAIAYTLGLTQCRLRSKNVSESNYHAKHRVVFDCFNQIHVYLPTWWAAGTIWLAESHRVGRYRILPFRRPASIVKFLDAFDENRWSDRHKLKPFEFPLVSRYKKIAEWLTVNEDAILEIIDSATFNRRKRSKGLL